jgi:hypothetical protein
MSLDDDVAEKFLIAVEDDALAGYIRIGEPGNRIL